MADGDDPDSGDVKVNARMSDAELAAVAQAVRHGVDVGDHGKHLSFLVEEVLITREALRAIARGDVSSSYDGFDVARAYEELAERALGDLMPRPAAAVPKRFLCRCGHYSDEHGETSDHKPELPGGPFYVKIEGGSAG